MMPPEFASRLAVALVLGSLIGIERQWQQRLAGLRTNALVAIGSALFAMLTPLSRDESSPTRVVAQIVSGIGFLAGAVIFREGLSVRGLNTAATLWTTAAVGTLAGLGFAAESVIGTGAILLINVVVRPIVRRINLQPFAGMEAATPYLVRVVCRSEEEQHVRALILQAMSDTSLLLHAISSRDLEDASKVEVRASVAASGRAEAALERIVGRLSLVPSVSSAGWQVDSRNGEMTRAGET